MKKQVALILFLMGVLIVVMSAAYNEELAKGIEAGIQRLRVGKVENR